MRHKASYFIVTTLVAASAAFAACGSDSSSTDGTSADSGSAQEAADAATKRLASLYDESTFESPPTEGPAPEPGKNIWSITLGLAQDASADFDTGVHEAGELVGWDVTSCDGEFSPDKWTQCIRNAITDQADGMALYVIDCPSVQAPLKEAAEAGIKIVGVEAPDCSDVKEGADSLFDAKVSFTQGNFDDWLRAQAEANADFIIAETGGQAQIIDLWETDAWALNTMHDAFVAQVENECPDCEIVETIQFVGADLEGALNQKVEQALLQHPDANAIHSQYDDPSLTIAPAVRQAEASGRELVVTGGVGGEAAVDLIRDDRGIDGEYTYDIEWEGFHAVDTLNRLFNGEDPVPSGDGIGYIDAENGLPPEGQGWTTSVDFKSAYKQAWGVG